MSRSVWKWMFGISVVLLLGLCLFTVGIWAFGNATAAMAAAITGMVAQNQFITFGNFVANIVNSPIFIVFCAVAALMTVSMVMLLVYASQKKS